MSSSLDTAASKKYGPTTDRAKGGAEEALLRLEEGLRDAGLRAALLGKALHSLSACRKLLHSRHADSGLAPRSFPELRSSPRRRCCDSKRACVPSASNTPGGAFSSRTRRAADSGRHRRRRSSRPVASQPRARASGVARNGTDSPLMAKIGSDR